MPEPLALLLVAAAGLLAGVASGLFGVGGGVLMVPAALHLVPGTTFHDAKAASLLVIVASAGVGAWTHHRRASVDWRSAAPLALGGALGTLASVGLVERVQDATLQAGFGLVLAAMGLHLALRRAPRPRDHAPRHARALLAFTGALGGVLAGAFGVGGGIVMVPGLLAAGAGMHLAVGTSLAAVAGNAVVGTALHATLGYGAALLALGVPLAAGAVPGTRLGGLLAHRLDAARLRTTFGAFLVLVGAATALDALV